MSKGINLHPKYGLNPTLGICNWCGEESGEIGLLGFNGGKEAPRHAILSDEPCPKCKAHLSEGITVMLMTCEGGRRLAWIVAKEEPFLAMLNGDTKEEVRKKRRCAVGLETWEAMGLAYPKDTE